MGGRNVPLGSVHPFAMGDPNSVARVEPCPVQPDRQAALTENDEGARTPTASPWPVETVVRPRGRADQTGAVLAYWVAKAEACS